AQRHHRLRRVGLTRSHDDVAEVVTTTLQNLARSDFRNLRAFLAQWRASEQPNRIHFNNWLYGALDFVIQEHLRKAGRHRPPIGGNDAADIEAPSAKPSISSEVAAGEIFAFVDLHFTRLERSALYLHFRGDQDAAGIARTLDLASTDDAKLLVRRLVARLRYQFNCDAP
ncbi:MAG: hypothetical protein RL385_1250, partial [Pseudomonadota bacterium]